MTHTTNYFNTLIQPSEDCAATAGIIPARPDTVAGLQYALLVDAPYTLTSDDLLVAVTALRRNIPADERGALKDELFSKGQPCLRASPLVKTHGWGVHHNAQGKIALVGRDTDAFRALRNDPAIVQIMGMRSKRA